MRRVAAPLLILALLLGWTRPAAADDVRPVSLDVRETAPGRYDVRFQTPMRGGRRLRVRPRLPRGAEVVAGTYDRQVAGDSSIERFTVELAGGLVGHEIGVDGLGLSSRNALLRVRLRDGRVLRAVLGGARPVLLVEAPPTEVRDSWTTDAARAAEEGLRCGLGAPVQILLVLGLVLAASTSGSIAALALFLLLTLAGAALGVALPPAFRPSPDLASAFAALAACLSAREALLGTARRLGGLAALAGLMYGMGLSGSSGSVLEVAGFAFGLDLAHLTWAAVFLLLFRAMPGTTLRRAGAWTAGVLAVAFAIGLGARPNLAESAPRAPGLLPASLAGDAAPGAGASQRAPGLETDVEAYLDVGVFETRLEILARFATLHAWLGRRGSAADPLPIPAQAAVLAQTSAALLGRLAVTIDGRAVEPDAIRSGFAVQEATGTYIRDDPVEEQPTAALVGIVYVFTTPAIPETVAVTWSDLPLEVPELRARIIDPELSRDVRVAAATPRLLWENTLREDPLPDVATIRVRPHPVPLPLLSLGLLVAGLLAARRFTSRGERARGGVSLRAAVALAFLALPFLTADVSAWVGSRAEPTPREARAITSALLENVYRALNLRGEDAVYDRLALCLGEEARNVAYIDHRKALAFERVGGARTHVDAVELVDLQDLRATSSGGFEARVQWTVAGSVTHFGHRHLRQNRYVARLEILPAGGAWKIAVFDVEDLARER